MKMKFFLPLLSFLFSLTFWSQQMSGATYQQEINEFRKDREAGLKKNWLLVVGLDWLKQGENLVGSGPNSPVKLPSPAPAQLARLYQAGARPNFSYEIEFLTIEGVKVDGHPAKPATRYQMKTDAAGKPTLVEFKTINFHLIDRAGVAAVRTKDTNSDALKKFTKTAWWPADEKARIVAKYVKLPQPKVVRFQDVINNSNEVSINGFVEFEFEGQRVSLYPNSEGETLEFVFRDSTSGKESYGAARYLSAAPPNAKGEVILDFNKAYNPPCAVTAFATCPLPPPENILKVAIRAGELKPEWKK